MSEQLNVKRSKTFSEFLNSMKDFTAKAKILKRIKRLEMGNWGDAEPVGDGVTELRIDYGPGYRVYCAKQGKTVVILLGAGTKQRQQKDIDAAKADAKLL